MQIVNAPQKVKVRPALLKADVDRWTGQTDDPDFDFVSALLLTEVSEAARAAVLDGRPGITLTHDNSGPGRGECAILTKDAAREVIATEWIQLTDGGGKGRLVHPAYAVVAITRAPSGRLTLFTGAHLPAHIEGIWARIPLPDRVKAKVLLREGKVNPGILAWLEAVHRWRAGVVHLAAEHHVDDIVVAPDGNVDAHKKWVRQMIHRAWPGLNLVATTQPDLGRRTVGWVLTTLDLVEGKVYRGRASDHKAGRYVLKHVNAPHPEPKPKPAPKPPPPFEHVTYNGALMDNKTKTAVQLGEKRLGFSLTILQGCYHPGVSQSAGTHDGGQVIDFAPFDQAHKVRVFREMGWFIWHRLPIPGVWSEHIHGGIRNGGTLSPSAARQQVDYDMHPPRDGLASHSIDNTPHPSPPVGFDYAEAWREING